MSERAMDVLHNQHYCPEKCMDMVDAMGAICGCAANIEAAIARAVNAEREAIAVLLDQMASSAATANESFVVIGDAENAERHRMRRETFLSAAAAIRARGETPE